ncbi:hypothetical protein IQ13_3422 [Lacibacter cauensis]|uniref:Cyclic GMP-AMP synthase n=1 Tax=Lacibacter cauensis TaxID=510947 RepID=A0A562SE30_9BACT|nr:nucleotidyltransferase [Lacibacter cauensis]TWI79030.1 hypothetical protein IQ13_3422 [Lacibacter cauensis]
MLTIEQKQQFSDILEELGKTLDITETQYNAAVTSYTHVAEWLSQKDSPLADYSPEILPQGSFLLQTMIKPIHEDDELDIDLVCKLEKVRPGLTQYGLKHMVGDRLKSNKMLERLLKKPDGRRCWTLQYADSAKFHLDVLPSVVVAGYKAILEKAFSNNDFSDAERLGVRITDNTSPIYRTSSNLQEWMKSNPFGYAIWFQERSKTALQEIRLLSESIQPVPNYQTKKMPLQRIVQILKRHRDMMFNGDDDKPISIIITTLAAKAYGRETNIIEGLINVVNNMTDFIEDRWSARHGKSIKWVVNPVNEQENFADKWVEYPQRQKNFYRWLEELKKDLNNVLGQKGRGQQFISESMIKPFGKEAVTKTFSNYGAQKFQQRESGILKMAAGTGTIGNVGTTIKGHNFHGK